MGLALTAPCLLLFTLLCIALLLLCMLLALQLARSQQLCLNPQGANQSGLGLSAIHQTDGASTHHVFCPSCTGAIQYELK